MFPSPVYWTIPSIYWTIPSICWTIPPPYWIVQVFSMTSVYPPHLGLVCKFHHNNTFISCELVAFFSTTIVEYEYISIYSDIACYVSKWHIICRSLVSAMQNYSLKKLCENLWVILTNAIEILWVTLWGGSLNSDLKRLKFEDLCANVY